MRDSGAVSPDQVDSLLVGRHTPAEEPDVASVATLPATPIGGSSARRAS
ncbi:hypothetical protein [Gordonia sp. (in: high G+C Gram-positive bacteria)]